MSESERTPLTFDEWWESVQRAAPTDPGEKGFARWGWEAGQRALSTLPTAATQEGPEEPPWFAKYRETWDPKHDCADNDMMRHIDALTSFAASLAGQLARARDEITEHRQAVCRHHDQIIEMRAELERARKALDIASRYVELQNAPWASNVQREDRAVVRTALAAADAGKKEG